MVGCQNFFQYSTYVWSKVDSCFFGAVYIPEGRIFTIAPSNGKMLFIQTDVTLALHVYAFSSHLSQHFKSHRKYFSATTHLISNGIVWYVACYEYQNRFFWVASPLILLKWIFVRKKKASSFKKEIDGTFFNGSTKQRLFWNKIRIRL